MKGQRIYFDNAATTPLFDNVKKAITDAVENNFGNPSSIHALGRTSRSIIESARKSIAKELKASTAEVFFTSGATESNNMAIQCAIRDLAVSRIISSPIEHHCILDTLHILNEQGKVNLELVRVDESGEIDLTHLEDLLMSSNEKTMVSLLHANNEIGTMIDLQQVSELCEKSKTLLHVDCVQSFTKFPIDLSHLNIQFLSASAHKMHGPKGIGMLYINAENMVKPFITGGAQERNMRAGTENIYGIIGFAKAVDEMISRQEEYRSHVTDLRNYFKSKLSDWFPDILYNGTQEGTYLYTVLNVAFPPHPYSDLLMMNLDIEGICVSAGSACSSGVESRSHVLNAINVPQDHKSIRFSFSIFNTREEVDICIQKLVKIFEPESMHT